MHAVAKITTTASVPCEVSLESPMACGIGICFSCVARFATNPATGLSPYMRRRSRL